MSCQCDIEGGDQIYLKAYQQAVYQILTDLNRTLDDELWPS
jgi:hypothetical protein